MADEKGRDGEGRERREPRLRDIARRFFVEGEELTQEDRGRLDPRDMLGAMLETGDKAKTEVVRMVAREVRNYLDELKIREDVHHLLTNYSLEVHASLSLKPLAKAVSEGEGEQGHGKKRGRRTKEPEEGAE